MSTKEQTAPSEAPKPLTLFAQRAFLFLSSLSVGMYFTENLYHPKVFGHLTVGQWIVSEGACPRIDIWTEVFNGARWFPSGWLFNFWLGHADAFLGLYGLALVKLFLTGTFAVLLAYSAAVLSSSRFIGFLAALPALAGTLYAVPLIPELAGYSLFAALLFISYRMPNINRPAASIAGIFFVSVLYANLDSTLIGAVICSALILAGGSFAEPQHRRTAVIGTILAGAAALFCTPYLGADLSQFPDVINAVFIDLLARSRPAHIFHYGFGFMAMLTICYFVLLHYAEHALKKTEVALIVALVLLGSAHREYIPYALIVLSMACASLWQRAGDDLGPLGEGLVKLRDAGALFGASTREGSMFFLGACAVVFSVQVVRAPLDRSALPHEELEFVESRESLLPMLHDSYVGGYVVSRFSDANGVPFARAALDQRTVWLDPTMEYSAERLNELGYGWQDLMDKTAPNSVLCLAESPLCALLERDPGWKLAFERALKEDGGVSIGEELSWQVYKKAETEGT